MLRAGSRRSGGVAVGLGRRVGDGGRDLLEDQLAADELAADAGEVGAGRVGHLARAVLEVHVGLALLAVRLAHAHDALGPHEHPADVAREAAVGGGGDVAGEGVAARLALLQQAGEGADAQRLAALPVVDQPLVPAVEPQLGLDGERGLLDLRRGVGGRVGGFGLLGGGEGSAQGERSEDDKGTKSVHGYLREEILRCLYTNKIFPFCQCT